MAAPAWITAGASAIGALSGLFGGHGGGTDPNLAKLYAKYNTALDMAMNLYKTATGDGPDSFKATDARALQEYQDMALKQGQALLGSYDASAAAAGSPISQTDTAKEQSRSNIAGGISQSIAEKKFTQDETLLAREAALLPQPGQYAQGFQGAASLDQANSAQQSDILNAVLNIAGAFGKTPYNQGQAATEKYKRDPFNGVRQFGFDSGQQVA